MPERPLLILPQSDPLPREGKPNFPREFLRLPSKTEQAERFSSKFKSMRESFLDSSPEGTSPANILVLETVGKVEDFKAAANKIPGLEWQGEVDVEDIESDDFFFKKPKIGVRFFKTSVSPFNAEESKEIQQSLLKSNLLDEDGCLKEDCFASDIHSAIPEEYKEHSQFITEAIIVEKKKPLTGRIYLSLSNRQALDQVKNLFDKCQSGEKAPHLIGAWKNLFSHLKDIRYWDVEDRVRDTGILDFWKEEIEIKHGTSSTIPFEIELSFSDDPRSRLDRQQLIKRLVLEEGGSVIKECLIPEIRFHALKVELPVDSIERVLKKQYGALFKSGGILFFRPAAQCAQQIPDGILDEFESIETPNADPIVALLDGMPLANHALLNGFLIIDDPDNFFEDYQSNEFRHGTAMASLICHGELDSGEKPLSRKIYVRPILKPENILNGIVERIPSNIFFEDLIERSVRRMFEGDGDEPPAAPTVKIINLSVADSSRIFHRVLSPIAKLLDWLSFKYSVLFCVSSGNVTGDFNLLHDDKKFAELKDDDKVVLTLKNIDSKKRNRRLFSPSEAINVISVGALHDDMSQFTSLNNRVDILPNRTLLSPFSVVGHGFHSAIKPEILIPGGRQLYDHHGEGKFSPSDSPEPPGQRVAGAPVSPGEINRTLYTRGTSNATALASRGAAFIYDALEQLFDERGEELPDINVVPLLKALLVHSASWGNAADIISSALELKGHKKKELARFLGYGIPDIKKSIDCTSSRATAIGFGTLKKDERHDFRFPLPVCLSAVSLWRRLTITLGWLSPINPENRKYRRAHLSFVPTGLDEQIGGNRNEADWQQVKNGAVQHEIFEGKKIVPLLQGDALLIPVQCRKDAGNLDSDIPYGLAISLEAKEDIPIYEEVKEGIDLVIMDKIGDRIR